MISIFAREITDSLTSLVKKIDAVVAKNQGKKMAALVVLLSEDPKATGQKLKELAAKQKIKKTPLTVFKGVGGPNGYKIAKDAQVTVVMWNKKKVVVNHAFRKGELTAAAIDKVVASTSKLLK